MNYQESIVFLNSTKQYGGKLGLENITNLLNELGNPERELKVIHLAGTNGKGSISNIINSILIDANYTVGIFNSPYIISLKETIKINNMEISEEDFASTTIILKEACTRLTENSLPHPTIFECVTALCLLYFENKKVDFAIIETGLGGKDDATNVFIKPLLSIITSIDYDHMEYLGNTLTEIASHKAGIIKPNCPVVMSPNPKEVVDVIEETCHLNDSKMYYVSLENNIFSLHSHSKNGMNFNIKNQYIAYEDLRSKLIGNHQLTNISTALLAVHVLQKTMNIPVNSIYSGLTKTKVSSRCEYIENKGHFLLDGAHNHQSMNALTTLLIEYFNDFNITILFGALGDKDIDSMLKSLSQFSSSITLTRPISERATDLEDLKNLATKYFENISLYDSPYNAFDILKEKASDNDLLLVTGSLYLTTFIKNYMEHGIQIE